MRIKYLGHSAFEIFIAGSVCLIDPWIVGNPKSCYNSTNDVTKPDFVFVTHEHEDHGFKDAVEIAKNTGAKIVATFDTAQKAAEQGVDVIAGNTGGKIELTSNLKVHFTHAIHPTSGNQPIGFVLESKVGSIYHAGDTALFSDMELIGNKVNITVALLPIGDVFTMDEEDAIYAAKLLKCEYIIPMHYDTFEVLTGNPNKMRNLLSNPDKLKVLNSGDEYTFNELV